MPKSIWHTVSKIFLVGLSILSRILFPYLVDAQSAIGGWNDYLNYGISFDVTVSPKTVFSSNGLSLLSFDKEYRELRRLSTVNMLSEVGIASIDWSQDYETLVIAYSSTNIDLLQGNSVINIPDIYRKQISEGKVINKVRCDGRYAYIACGFGIVVIDLEKREVRDTWRPSISSEINGVNDIAFGDEHIYAATDNGLFVADKDSDGLTYFGNWFRIENIPTSRYNAIVYSSGKSYANNVDDSSGDVVYVVNDDCAMFLHESGVSFNSFDLYADGFVFTSSQKIFIYNADGVLRKTINGDFSETPNMMRTIVDGNDIWIADAYNGFMRYNDSSVDYLTLEGPVFTDGFNLFYSDGVTAVAGGGVNESWNNLARQAMFSIFAGGHWVSATSDNRFDAMKVVVDPTDKTRIMVSTYGNGLLEYSFVDGKLLFVRDYTRANSPIEGISGDNTERISGIDFDADGNLWVVQPQVSQNIKMLKHDGSWIVYPNNINTNRTGDLFISSKGVKWIVIPNGGGIYLFDDNGTPEDFSDDKSRFLTVKDSEGTTFGNIYCVAEDLDGFMWVGTDKGPLVYTNQTKCFDSSFAASRIKIARSDGSGLADYLLGTEIITSIDVDGGNRIWFGTKKSGVYLVSASDNEVIKHFTTLNSPLFSDSITSLSVDGKGGYVWIQTPNGLLTYRGDATDGGSGFKDVYAFPNPVRETYDGDLTITGLERNTQIRITDVSGNLVYSTTSEGGQATWNLKSYNGKRVATGVYLIFCASEDGSKSNVIKILVIH